MAQAVTVSKTVSAATAGNLTKALTISERNTVTNLTITGTLDARDFKYMRDSMPLLSVLDLSGVNIAKYVGTGGTNGTISSTYPVNTVPQDAFYSGVQNTTLVTVTLPISVTVIGEAAFAESYKLNKVDLPPNLTTIKMGGVLGCMSLTTIIIPASVESIGDMAFQNCTGLTSIQVNNPVPIDLTISPQAFEGVRCPLYVPAGAMGYYANPISGGGWDWSNGGFIYGGDIIEGSIPVNLATVNFESLKIGTQNGQIIIGGLKIGERVTIYNLPGEAIYNEMVASDVLTINLPKHGVYILKIGALQTKIIN
jgi:hypothetical protein